MCDEGRDKHGTYTMLGKTASEPEIGLPVRIPAAFYSGKLQKRPSGRPKSGRKADFEAFPTRIRLESGPVGRLPARRHYCVT